MFMLLIDFFAHSIVSYKISTTFSKCSCDAHVVNRLFSHSIVSYKISTTCINI